MINDASGVNGWRDLSIDLTHLAERSPVLQIVQSAASGADALWKRVEFVIE